MRSPILKAAVSAAAADIAKAYGFKRGDAVRVAPKSMLSGSAMTDARYVGRALLRRKVKVMDASGRVSLVHPDSVYRATPSR
jgi:hypothetical protein